jgi:VanZ family protein
MTAALRALFYAAVALVVCVSVLPADALWETDIWDKAEHASAYAFLALLGSLAYRSTGQRWKLAASLVALGVGLEIMQTQIPGRVGDFYDATANTVGVVLGLIATALAGSLRSFE